MSAEYPTQAELESTAAKMNELASQLGLTEDERSLILIRVSLELHGEGTSNKLEMLRGLVGPHASEIVEGLIKDVDYWLSRGTNDFDLRMKIEQLVDSRRDDTDLREFPL